jgi:hypothetical protein
MPFALVALLAAQAAPLPAVPACQNAKPGVAAAGSLYDHSGGVRAQRLGELPPADLILTVLRREGGCERPVIVRYGIGGTPVHRP